MPVPCCRATLSLSLSVHTQVLQLPVLRPRNAKKLLSDGLQGPQRAAAILGSSNANTLTTDDTLEQFLQHAGVLFGADPSKLEKVGEYEAQGCAAAALTNVSLCCADPPRTNTCRRAYHRHHRGGWQADHKTHRHVHWHPATPDQVIKQDDAATLLHRGF